MGKKVVRKVVRRHIKRRLKSQPPKSEESSRRSFLFDWAWKLKHKPAEPIDIVRPVAELVEQARTPKGLSRRAFIKACVAGFALSLPVSKAISIYVDKHTYFFSYPIYHNNEVLKREAYTAYEDLIDIYQLRDNNPPLPDFKTVFQIIEEGFAGKYDIDKNLVLINPALDREQEVLSVRNDTIYHEVSHVIARYYFATFRHRLRDDRKKIKKLENQENISIPDAKEIISFKAAKAVYGLKGSFIPYDSEEFYGQVASAIKHPSQVSSLFWGDPIDFSSKSKFTNEQYAAHLIEHAVGTYGRENLGQIVGIMLTRQRDLAFRLVVDAAIKEGVATSTEELLNDSSILDQPYLGLDTFYDFYKIGGFIISFNPTDNVVKKMIDYSAEMVGVQKGNYKKDLKEIKLSKEDLMKGLKDLHAAKDRQMLEDSILLIIGSYFLLDCGIGHFYGEKVDRRNFLKSAAVALAAAGLTVVLKDGFKSEVFGPER